MVFVGTVHTDVELWVVHPQSPERERDPHAPNLGWTEGAGPAATPMRKTIHTRWKGRAGQGLTPQAVHHKPVAPPCGTMSQDGTFPFRAPLLG